MQLVPFDGLRGKRVLDVGCGTGVDLVRFAQGGAVAIGVDLADSAIGLARQNFAQRGLAASSSSATASGCHLPRLVDYVFAHGVVQYTADGQRVVDEVRRVLGPAGRRSSRSTTASPGSTRCRSSCVSISNTKARRCSQVQPGEFRALLGGFSDVRLVFERFPVKSRLHGGWKGLAFNTMFVGTFNALRDRGSGRYGWHLLAFCRK